MIIRNNLNKSCQIGCENGDESAIEVAINYGQREACQLI